MIKKITSGYLLFFCRFRRIGILFFLFFIFSCKKDTDISVPVDFGYTYFPIDIGRYVIYEVDSIAYDDIVHPPDTSRYLLKELIASSFLDNSGRITFRIERYYKIYNSSIPYDSIPWIGPRVWFANQTTTTAERVEENLRYIKLVFPSSKGKEWNGNAYNTLDQKNYEILSSDQAELVNSTSFDSVVTVLQSEEKDFIRYIYEVEKYARGVGLVYKERDSIYDGGTEDTVGYMFKQKIVSYGR